MTEALSSPNKKTGEMETGQINSSQTLAEREDQLSNRYKTLLTLSNEATDAFPRQKTINDMFDELRKARVDSTGLSQEFCVEFAIRIEALWSNPEIPISHLHGLLGNLTSLMEETKHILKIRESAGLERGENSEQDLTEKVISELSNGISDENFVSSARRIQLIGNMISARQLTDIMYNLDLETVKNLNFLYQKSESLNNYLLKSALIEILDFSFSGTDTRKNEPLDRSHVFEDIDVSIGNMLKFGLLNGKQIRLAADINTSGIGVEYQNMFIDVDEEGNAVLFSERNGEFIKKISKPDNSLPVTDSHLVLEMGTDNLNDYLLLELSTEYMGVFDHQGRLIRYFDKSIGAKAEPLKPSDIYELKNILDVIRAQGNVDALEAFVLSSELPLRRLLEKEIGCRFSGLSAREQFWLFNYFTYATPDDIDKIHDFNSKFGINGLKTFLSVEYEKENGDCILEMSVALGNNDLTEIFSRYAKIVSHAQKVAMAVNPEKAEEIIEGVLRRSKELTIGAWDVSKGNPDLSIEDIIKAMQTYEALLKSLVYDVEIHSSEMTGQLRGLYRRYQGNENLSGVVSTFMEHAWLTEIRKQKDEKILETTRITSDFYERWESMNAQASETTGDTEIELDRTSKFIRYLTDKGAKTILDAGCGDGQRITIPLARVFPDIQFRGVDLVATSQSSVPNVSFKRGDLTEMAGIVADGSVDSIISTWSVANDVLDRRAQIKMVTEFARVLKNDGHILIDVPYLEGGSGSWEQAAEKYHRDHPDSPYGTIVADFDIGGSMVGKEFFIYPMDDLLKIFRDAGFEIVDDGDKIDIEREWRTHNGKPRYTLIAQKTGRPSSNILTYAAA